MIKNIENIENLEKKGVLTFEDSLEFSLSPPSDSTPSPFRYVEAPGGDEKKRGRKGPSYYGIQFAEVYLVQIHALICQYLSKVC